MCESSGIPDSAQELSEFISCYTGVWKLVQEESQVDSLIFVKRCNVPPESPCNKDIVKSKELLVSGFLDNSHGAEVFVEKKNSHFEIPLSQFVQKSSNKLDIRALTFLVHLAPLYFTSKPEDKCLFIKNAFQLVGEALID